MKCRETTRTSSKRTDNLSLLSGNMQKVHLLSLLLLSHFFTSLCIFWDVYLKEIVGVFGIKVLGMLKNSAKENKEVSNKNFKFFN
jgi:hypothetical protein